MFQFPPYALLERSICLLADGLPHSEIHGSLLLCSSPQLIAALHVLHRLCMPRHPPCALNLLLLYGLHSALRAQTFSYSCYWFIVGRGGTNLPGYLGVVHLPVNRQMPYYCIFHRISLCGIRPITIAILLIMSKNCPARRGNVAGSNAAIHS